MHSILMFVSNIKIPHAHCYKLSTLLKFEKLRFFKTISLFTTLYSFVWLKERQWNYGSITTYPQWIVRGLENFIS